MDQYIIKALYLLIIYWLFKFSRDSSERESGKDFWKSAIPFTLLFAFVEGTRKWRGIDWANYRDALNFHDDSQWGFETIKSIMRLFQFDSTAMFFTFSLILVVATFWMIKQTFNEKEAKWMYFWSIASMFIWFEGFVRQFVAIPIAFCVIPFLFRETKRWEIIIPLLIFIPTIHFGTLPLVLGIMACCLFTEKTFPVHIWLVLLFLSYFFFSSAFFIEPIHNMVELVQQFGLFNDNERVNAYVEGDFLREGGKVDWFKQSELTLFLQFITEACTIIISCWACKIEPNKKVYAIMNIAFFGFCFTRIFWDFEIFRRFFIQFAIMWFIPFGYALYIFYDETVIKNNIVRFCVYTVFIYRAVFFAFRFLNQHLYQTWIQ